MSNIQSKSFYLFAVPSFKEGLARIMDLCGTLEIYNYSNDGATADKIALSNDWDVISKDFKKALDTYRMQFDAK